MILDGFLFGLGFLGACCLLIALIVLIGFLMDKWK